MLVQVPEAGSGRFRKAPEIFWKVLEDSRKFRSVGGSGGFRRVKGPGAGSGGFSLRFPVVLVTGWFWGQLTLDLS